MEETKEVAHTNPEVNTNTTITAPILKKRKRSTRSKQDDSGSDNSREKRTVRIFESTESSGGECSDDSRGNGSSSSGCEDHSYVNIRGSGSENDRSQVVYSSSDGSYTTSESMTRRVVDNEVYQGDVSHSESAPSSEYGGNSTDNEDINGVDMAQESTHVHVGAFFGRVDRDLLDTIDLVEIFTAARENGDDESMTSGSGSSGDVSGDGST
mmetsp:Transcript_8892/g.13333  ORF Transcript_8892/g.13333 Transcript_8892/m.13333 type:complete len:211 (-) Transcript_8892:185-817(-)